MLNVGGPDMAPRLFKRRGPRPPRTPPASVRSAPAQPWRSSITREWPRHGPPRGAAVTWLDELLAQLDLAAHGDGALGGDRPALAAALGRAAAQLERRGVEERRARLRRVGDDPPPPVRIAREVHEQRRGERPVHDEARIALDVHRPRAVVVNAVAGEGQRRAAA